MSTVTFRVQTVVVAVTAATVAVVVTLMFVSAWRVDAAPGDVDTTYVPITPCRLVALRPAPDTVGPRPVPLGADELFVQKATGSNGNCVIPSAAVGLTLNVTALSATKPTFITLWGSGPRPEASHLNPAPGQPPTPNAVTIPLSGSGSFNIYNLDGSVSVIVDVVGYHTKSNLRELAAAQPFVVTSTETSNTGPTPTPAAFVSVDVTAPVAGHVTLHSVASVGHFDEGGDVGCVLVKSSGIPNSLVALNYPSAQWWEAAKDATFANLSGTRTFSIAKGQTTSYSLACVGSSGAIMYSRTLTAMFTPAP